MVNRLVVLAITMMNIENCLSSRLDNWIKIGTNDTVLDWVKCGVQSFLNMNDINPLTICTFPYHFIIILTTSEWHQHTSRKKTNIFSSLDTNESA